MPVQASVCEFGVRKDVPVNYTGRRTNNKIDKINSLAPSESSRWRSRLFDAG